MEISLVESMSRFGKLWATLSVCGLSLGIASCAPLEGGRVCIDVNSADWKEKLDSQFGKQVCLLGAIYPGADGVFFEVDPPWGFPPYGSLISLSIKQKQVYGLDIKVGDRVSVEGTLLGRGFCKRIPMDGCNQTDAQWFEYYLFNARLLSN
ncbi:MAG: hypothetical protein ACK59B_02090 [Alphaproteobacteria bacterium]